MSERYLTADGTPTSATDSGAGVVTVFVNSEGIQSTTASLPMLFDPLNASPALLSAFALPPRPAGAADVADWLATYVDSARGQAPARVCESNASGASISSGNWSGHIDYGYNIKKASGVFIQPSFVSACAHASTHAIWSGLGGTSGKGLMQVGTAGEGAISQIDPWYEIYPLEVEQVGSLPNISAGDEVQATTTWDPGSQTAYFNVLNVTTGSSHTYQQSGSLIADYYSGGTAEYIDERMSNSNLTYPVDGKYYYYRKPGTSDLATHWISEYTDGVASGNSGWSPDGIYMQRPNGTVLGTAAVGSNWSTHYWKACA